MPDDGEKTNSTLAPTQGAGQFRTKNRRQRIVPLNDAAVSVLRRLPKVSENVFTNTEGRRLKEGYLSQCFTAVVGQAKLRKRICFHSLRHTFASWLVQAGAGIYEVQKLLGYSSVAVTQVYSHLAPSELHAKVGKIDFELR
jgi:site-specific recombinase XerD